MGTLSDGGAPLEGYKVAVRDAKRQMWMEVGRVNTEVQKLKIQDLEEGSEYFIRIFAKNEVGFSDPLEKIYRHRQFRENLCTYNNLETTLYKFMNDL